MTKTLTSIWFVLPLVICGLTALGCKDNGGGGGSYVEVFVTSETFEGDLGGLDGADVTCTSMARAVGLSGDWTAWLSEAGGTNAGTRIADAEYRLLDGTVIADDLDDLTDGTLDAPIDLDEIRGTGGSPVVRVFVTKGTFDGNLDGLDGADAECTDAANAAGQSGEWTAWLSDNTRDARDFIPDGEYRLLDGLTVVAYDLDDLTDGTLEAAIDLDEDFDDVLAGAEVWTSSDSDGTNPSFASCADWSTASDSNTGRVGVSTATDATWTSFAGRTCDLEKRLYCFEALPRDEVWTSTAEGGTNTGFGSCADWSTDSDGSSGRVGDSTATDATWTNFGGRGCDQEKRLYCFSDLRS